MNAIEQSRENLQNLSTSRRNTLIREARKFIRENPGSADHNGFWQRLSARQVLETAHEAKNA